MSLGHLPSGWKWSTFNDIRAAGRNSIAGGPFGSELTRADYVSGPGVPVIRGSNMGGTEGVFQQDEFAYVSEKKACELHKCRAVPGDLVFTQRGTLGQVVEIPGCARFPTFIVSQSQMKVTVDDRLADRRYLLHYFRSPHASARLAGKVLATGVPHINLGILKDFPLPLPPLPEQRRIAAILDKADTIRRKRREVLALADEFLRSAFLEMFGDPVVNPRGWPDLQLETCIQAIEPGWSCGGEGRAPAPGEKAVLKISAVTSGRFRPEECKVVEGTVPTGLISPRKGDLLFSRANTRELVAATCLVLDDYPNLFLPDKLWRLVPWANVMTGEYLRYLLADEGFRDRIRKQATGSSGSMLNVSQAKVLAVAAPVPPLDAQRRFADLVWQHVCWRERLNRGVQQADELFDSLVHRAFSGGL